MNQTPEPDMLTTQYDSITRALDSLIKAGTYDNSLDGDDDEHISSEAYTDAKFRFMTVCDRLADSDE
ncbi:MULTISPECIES: hypothetical protein [Haloferacaceae]|uniref:Uncharacterized protein n=2 Tax=Haloferacaceae TaxID=1644056 RepID=A0ABD6DBA6_9EURY|nr:MULTISPECIES: hypothetical protein [Halorubraceae]